jgi:ectoine hydroxylase-related dioxygenase (phytanoyl-CoA dioxygenase family)
MRSASNGKWTTCRKASERVWKKSSASSSVSDPVFARRLSSRHQPGQRRARDSQAFEDKLNLKLPGGSPYPWHQDWVCCWRAHTDELVTCFIYLDDADETNGCLQVIPGSQLGKPILPFKPGSRFEIDPVSFDANKAVPAPLKAGEMILFDSYLLHYSDLNRSRTPRRAIIYTYNPARMGKINELRFYPIEFN